MDDRRKVKHNTKHTGYQSTDHKLSLCTDIKYTCAEGKGNTQSGKDQRTCIYQRPHQIFWFAEDAAEQLSISNCRADTGDHQEDGTNQEACNDRNDRIKHIALKNTFLLIHLSFLLPS